MAVVNYRQYNNLITAQEVVNKAMANDNLDQSLIESDVILIAEITHLKQRLGDYFWGKLRQGNTVNSFYTLSANERILLDSYIKPALAFFVKYEVLNDIQFNTTSSGVVTNDDDWSDPVESSELSMLKSDTFRKAEILVKDMIDWLDDSDNDGEFPNYDHADNDKHRNGDNVTRLGGILAYGSKINRYRSINKKDERYYN
tara:strand:+ start:243 stop:842 length:600 start_codon:yes stop_codon:yes gene_type:complete